MNRDDGIESRHTVFKTSGVVSESRPWFVSLFDSLYDCWKAKRDPHVSNITAEPVPVPEIWTEHRTLVPRLMSGLTHVLIVVMAMIAPAVPLKPLPKSVINVAVYTPSLLIAPIGGKSGGGGGGGRHESTLPSLGKPPKPSDKQIVPPDPEPTKNLDPTLVVEPTVIAPQLETLPALALFTLGDPNGVPSLPSAGSGTGGGIGTGRRHGDGEGDGPGVGPGKNGGIGDKAFQVGGGVSAPVLLTQVLPEYSEEARKARYQGSVVLDTIVLEDGSVQVVRVVRSIGFGLDQKAIEAVLQWKFRPGRKNGNPVPVALNVQVNFNLR